MTNQPCAPPVSIDLDLVEVMLEIRVSGDASLLISRGPKRRPPDESGLVVGGCRYPTTSQDVVL